jgi:hypothetical protein
MLEWSTIAPPLSTQQLQPWKLTQLGSHAKTYNEDDDELDFDFEVNNDASLAVWQEASARTMTAHKVLAP